MRKPLIVDKQIKELTVDEAIELAKPTIFSIARSYINSYTKEDYIQEGCLVAWEAFEKYDITRGASYLTYLSWKLRQRFGQLLTKQTRKKRTVADGVKIISLDCPIEQEKNDFHSLFGTESFEEDLISKITVDMIMADLSAYEARLIPVLLKKIAGVDLANAEGTTRQNISNQVGRLKKKLRANADRYTKIEI